MKFFRDRADRHRKPMPGNMGFILPPPPGEWPGCPLLRASSDNKYKWFIQARLYLSSWGGLVDPRLRASNEHRPKLHNMIDPGCAFREQEDDQASLNFFLTNPSESVQWAKFFLLHTGCHPQLFRATYRSSDPRDDHHTRLRRQLFQLYTVCPIWRRPLAPPAYLGRQPVLSARTSVSSRTGAS